jgi:hypothetical protein
MVRVSNHGSGEWRPRWHDLVLRQAQDEVYLEFPVDLMVSLSNHEVG